MSENKKLVSIKEREFSHELDYAGNPRYVHLLESGVDGNNVKRQFDDVLYPLGVTKGSVRLLPRPGKIILTTEAYQVWQNFKEQEPGRKKRTSPELRLSRFKPDNQDDSTWVYQLSSDEVARIVAGTLTTNAATYNVPAVFNSVKKTNTVTVESPSLEGYIKAIKHTKPNLLNDNPDFKQYVTDTLQSLAAVATPRTQSTFYTYLNQSKAHAMAAFGIHADKTESALRRKAMQQDLLPSNDAHKSRELTPTN